MRISSITYPIDTYERGYMGRFECHSHSHYSNLRLLDCVNKPRDLVYYAAEIGLKGICLTDHEALGGHIELDRLQKEIIEQYPDFKIGKGNEIYLTDTRESNQRYWHFILIAKDAVGHKMLRELSSTAWQNSYYDRGLERVPTLRSELSDIIDKYGKGHLIASTACLGSEIDYHILQMDEAEQMNNIAGKKEHYNAIIDYVNFCLSLFGEDFYLEVQPAQSKEQLVVNKRMGAIGKHFSVKLIVTTDAHYLKKEDREIHKAYLNSKGGERETDQFYAAAYLQTTEEVIANLEGTGLDYAELEANTHEIYDKIEIYSFEKPQQVPRVKVKDYPKQQVVLGYEVLEQLYESDDEQERYWVNECINKLHELNLCNDTYLKRLEEEAETKKVIGDKLGTCLFAYPVFLQHYIDLFWECGSTVGAGRGSACSGLNHYLLGVTQLDPIKHDLPWWRYMNSERVELPKL